MPGDRWQQLANLRAYYSFMWTHPGKKLLFMGCEFGQEREWNHEASLDWHLLANPQHQGIQALVRDLNHLYKDRPALHVNDCDASGFEWIETHDSEHSLISYLRKGADPADQLLVVCNFTPVPRQGVRVGVPSIAGVSGWREAFNSDSSFYGGSNVGNGPNAQAIEAVVASGRAHSITLTLPPLATLVLEPMRHG